MHVYIKHFFQCFSGGFIFIFYLRYVAVRELLNLYIFLYIFFFRNQGCGHMVTNSAFHILPYDPINIMVMNNNRRINCITIRCVHACYDVNIILLCVNTHTHTHTRAHTHTHTHTQMHRHIHTHTKVCINQ